MERSEHKEAYFQTRIIAALRKEYPDAFIWKAQAGPYSRGGIPDVLAVIQGRFYGFEVKRPENGRLTKIQGQTIKQINAAGGTALVVSYPEQALAAIRDRQAQDSLQAEPRQE